MRDAVLRQPTAAALAGAAAALALAVVYGANPWMTATVTAVVFAGAWIALRTAAAERTVAGHGASSLTDDRYGADVSWHSIIDALLWH
jgi:hypothetical protein